MSAVLQTHGLGKRYRRLWALTECTLSIPAGLVMGLVGPNGAGKSTLLNLAVGLLTPTTGTIEVLGAPPPATPAQLARGEFLQELVEAIAEQELSVVLSSHLISDLERICDYLIVLVGSRVRVAGPVDELLATHHLLSGRRRDPATLPAGQEVISASHTDRQTTLLVRTSDPILDPAWTVSEVGLEDLVLTYMRQATGRARRRDLEVQK